VSGGRTIVADQIVPTSARLGTSVFCDPLGFRSRRRPCWLGRPLESVVTGERIHPFFARRRRRHTDLRLRLDVVARDRLVAPKQSVDPGTTGGPVTTGPAGSSVTPSHRVCGRPRLAIGRAPLLRFLHPLQRSPAAMRCPRAASPYLGTIPLRRWLCRVRPALVCGPFRTPLVPAVLRRADWMRGCSRWRTVRVSYRIESVARASA